MPGRLDGGVHRGDLAALGADRAAGRRVDRPTAGPAGDDHRRSGRGGRRGQRPGRVAARRGLAAATVGRRPDDRVRDGVLRTTHAKLVVAIVPARQLEDADSRLFGTESAMQTVGPGLGGLVAQALGATLGLVFDAASFVISAIFSRASGPGERSAPDPARPRPCRPDRRRRPLSSATTATCAASSSSAASPTRPRRVRHSARALSGSRSSAERVHRRSRHDGRPL